MFSFDTFSVFVNKKTDDAMIEFSPSIWPWPWTLVIWQRYQNMAPQR